MTLEKYTPQIGTTKKDSHNWHALGADAVLNELATMTEQRLTEAEAARRL